MWNGREEHTAPTTPSCGRAYNQGTLELDRDRLAANNGRRGWRMLPVAWPRLSLLYKVRCTVARRSSTWGSSLCICVMRPQALWPFRKPIQEAHRAPRGAVSGSEHILDAPGAENVACIEQRAILVCCRGSQAVPLAAAGTGHCGCCALSWGPRLHQGGRCSSTSSPAGGAWHTGGQAEA